MSASKVVIGTSSPGLAHLPWIRPYGDPDDHLRLSVLLASQLRERGDHDAADACLQRKLAWDDRLRHVKEFLQTVARPKGTFVAAIVDLDALQPSPLNLESTWDDPTFQKERAEFFRMIVEVVLQGAWLLVRPLPSSSMASVLSSLPSSIAQTESTKDATSLVPPALQLIVKRLVASGTMSQTTVKRHVKDGPADPDLVANILGAAYDSLPKTLREAAKKLAAVRPEQHFNGTAGHFTYGDGTARTVSKGAVAELVKHGFLQPGISPNSLLMPTALRHFVEPHADLTKEHQSIVQWLAEQNLGAGDREGKLEAHHLAIRSGAVEMAKSTAEYYGADLRMLAFQLSMGGQHAASASLYKHILDDIDPKDAYCWEYYAFNLARDPSTRDKPEYRQKILSAYKSAYVLARDNPLYHGRWLGYRAALGEDIINEINTQLAYYQVTLGPTAVTYFAEPVLHGLRRARKAAQAAAILKRFPWAERQKRD